MVGETKAQANLKSVGICATRFVNTIVVSYYVRWFDVSAVDWKRLPLHASNKAPARWESKLSQENGLP